MLLLIAEDFIKVEKISTVLPYYEELVEKTRQEPGCISYELTKDLKNEGHFIFLERWVNEDALTFHTKTEHFKRLVPLIDQHISEKAKYTRMEIIY
ncbi:putative quinol monooxygenase [Vagococcus hydrophili]|uniref:Antibiotic biosynthesis monooxygenase n=1 Tax=Vagococcus hydrophili TaxID=2714947 RepID=A0A6G8AW66_9ENTE|nr:putative quinol monooxygenase [Vagococcus hydrophili]QIL49202.1 antibiotic biosynthesis monooxygenase [Vagococcus hydrophili]